MKLTAFILNLIFTIVSGFFFLIPLAWTIPITVISYKIYKGTRPNTVGFGVIDLIFCNIISGILLLCDKKD